MKTMVITHLKGGVGKTTLAVNVACALASRSKRRHGVVLIDADTNAPAARWLERNPLLSVERLPFGEGTDKSSWMTRIAELGAGRDWCVIDLPANLGAVNAAALMLADLAVIPVTASGLDLTVTEEQLKLVRDVRSARGGRRPQILLVPSRVDRRTAIGREIEGELHQYNEPVGPPVTSRVQLVDAFTAKQWIGQFAPRSVAHQQIEALALVIHRSAEHGETEVTERHSPAQHVYRKARRSQART
jgi:chromosome partitioning protein